MFKQAAFLCSDNEKRSSQLEIHEQEPDDHDDPKARSPQTSVMSFQNEEILTATICNDNCSSHTVNPLPLSSSCSLDGDSFSSAYDSNSVNLIHVFKVFLYQTVESLSSEKAHMALLFVCKTSILL